MQTRKKLSLHVSAGQADAKPRDSSEADQSVEETSATGQAEASITGVESDGREHVNGTPNGVSSVTLHDNDNVNKPHGSPVSNEGNLIQQQTPDPFAITDIWAWKRQQAVGPSLR